MSRLLWLLLRAAADWSGGGMGCVTVPQSDGWAAGSGSVGSME